MYDICIMRHAQICNKLLLLKSAQQKLNATALTLGEAWTSVGKQPLVYYALVHDVIMM